MFQNFEIQPVAIYCPSGSEQQTCEACLNLSDAATIADEMSGEVVWGVYGRGEDGLAVHVADRQTYRDSARLVKALTGVSPPEISTVKVVVRHPMAILNPDAEPTNAVRAQRIDSLLMVYSLSRGEEQSETDVYELASLLTDIRHWCDREQIDFYTALDVSYQHYLEERQEA